MSFILLSTTEGDELRPYWVRRDCVVTVAPHRTGSAVHLSSGGGRIVNETPEEIISILGWSTTPVPEGTAAPLPDHVAEVLERLVTTVETLQQRVNDMADHFQPVHPAVNFYLDDPKHPIRESTGR